MEEPILFLKIGPKGRHVDIPDGWSKVTSGACLPGDKFVNLRYYFLQNVEADDIGVDANEFDHLYRKAKP